MPTFHRSGTSADESIAAWRIAVDTEEAPLRAINLPFQPEAFANVKHFLRIFRNEVKVFEARFHEADLYADGPPEPDGWAWMDDLARHLNRYDAIENDLRQVTEYSDAQRDEIARLKAEIVDLKQSKRPLIRFGSTFPR